MKSESPSRERDLGTYVLNSMLAIVFLISLAIAALYSNPPEHLIIPQREIAARISRVEDFPVGSSRLETLGDQPVLVVRLSEHDYRAVQGVSPVDGCLLRWDSEALRVTSPCGHQLYNLRGHAEEGLTTEPLRRYSVFVRSDIVYVTD